MSRIWYFGFSAAGTTHPPPTPQAGEGGGRVGGWVEKKKGNGECSCPEKPTPSSGCLHLLGTSVAVSIATGVKIVGMSQRYGVPSAVDC